MVSAFICVHLRQFAGRAQPGPVGKHVLGPSDHEEYGFGYISWMEHAGSRNEPWTMVRIEGVPRGGVGRPGGDEGKPHAGSAILLQQSLMETAEAVFARGIGRIL